ncbi:AGAP010849-PA, partial [Anopheles gambiae str. PEST]
MLAATTLFKMLLVTSILSQAVHCQRLLGRSRREATNTPLSSTDAPVEVSEAVDKQSATGEVLSTAASTRTQRSYYGGGSSERLFDLGGLLGSRTYYSGNRGYYPSGGYYP